jgi:hypothetical protein
MRNEPIHGHSRRGSRSPTYSTWACMLTRCRNQNSKSFPNYGGRGISICSEWEIFENFLRDMGERPIGKTLDRYPDNNGNYEPGNCRWATRKEQRLNSLQVRWYKHEGKTKCLTDWCRIFNIRYETAINRIDVIGMSFLDAMTCPNKSRKFSDEQVAHMRRSHLSGISASELSRTYGVCPGTMCDIVNGQTYAKVAT